MLARCSLGGFHQLLWLNMATCVLWYAGQGEANKAAAIRTSVFVGWGTLYNESWPCCSKMRRAALFTTQTAVGLSGLSWPAHIAALVLQSAVHSIIARSSYIQWFPKHPSCHELQCCICWHHWTEALQTRHRSEPKSFLQVGCLLCTP